MCDQPKIHVFLGAPPPSSGPAPASEAGVESERRPPAGWRHLELTWKDGRLRLATDEAGNQARKLGKDGTGRDDIDADPSTRGQEDQTHTDRDDSSSEADWTPEESRGREESAGSDSKFNAEVENTPTDDQNPAETFMSQGEGSKTKKEDQCSALVHEYLDSCFPAAQPEQEESEPEPGSGPEPEPPRCPEHRPSPAVPALCDKTQFLTTWTLSQALILRGRCGTQSTSSHEKIPPPQTPPRHAQTPASVYSGTPELFSPVTLSPGASAELFSQPCSTPRAEEGGVVLEAIADGVLCSQEAESTAALDSPDESPGPKRPRVSEGPGAEVPAESTAAQLQGPTTPLFCCCKPGARYSVLVAVVHPCHLKEVKVKSGPSAGALVPLASIVVTDQSGVEMKVVLWRQAAFWALTVSPGDILLITALQVNEDRWRGEMVLQSTFSSKLLSLGQIMASASPPVPQRVNARSVRALCEYLRERRPLLVSLPCRPPQYLNRLPYATLRSLRVNTLVHALLRVTHTQISPAWRSEAESRCRSAVQLKAVVTVEQPDGQQGVLLLWGAAVDWLPRFSRDKAAVWDFHILLVREGLTSDLPELHSTPWSSVQSLPTTDHRARAFLPPLHKRRGNDGGLELDLDTLLSQKYSGEVELRVQVAAFRFEDAPASQNAPRLVLDSSTPLDGILEALSGDVTYTGCGRCSAELDTDANGIYSPCYPCLPHTTVRRYYRPGVLTVSGRGSSRFCVQVPPVPLEKILDAPADKLHRSSALGSQVKHIQVAAQRIHALLSLPRKTFAIIIQSHFLCDENSVPLNQEFTLLDLQFPG